MEISESRRKAYHKLARLKMSRATLEEMMVALDVSKRTVQRWLLDNSFLEIWRDLQREWRESSQATVTEAGHEAIAVLRDLMQNARSEHVRFEAAAKIGEWAGLGEDEREEVRDDRRELVRLLELAAARRILPPGEVVEGKVVRSEMGDVSETQ